MNAPKDRAGDSRRIANFEKLQGKYGAGKPSKYDHEAYKDEMVRNDESLYSTEGQLPESWTQK